MRRFFSIIMAAALIAGCSTQKETRATPTAIKLFTPQDRTSLMAKEVPWITYGTANGMTFQMKTGSFGPGYDLENREIIGGFGRVSREGINQVEILQIYVTLEDCRKKIGTLYAANAQGVPVLKADFMNEGGTVASNMADSLCAVASAMRKI